MMQHRGLSTAMHNDVIWQQDVSTAVDAWLDAANRHDR